MITEVIAPRLLGPAIVIAVALIVKGYADVGDGFSAGVIVALAIALRYITLGVDAAERSLPILRKAPAIATGGLLVVLGVSFFPVARGDPPLTHLPRAGVEPVTIGTLEIITAVAFDLGLFFLVAAALVIVLQQLALLVEEQDR